MEQAVELNYGYDSDIMLYQPTYEEFMERLIVRLKKSEEEYAAGLYRDADEALTEICEELGIKGV